MLNLAIPIALATLAQMFVITGNDLDLSIGTFVGFVGCVTATWLREAPLFGALILLGSIGVYAALGALIHLRNISVDRRHARHELRLARPGDPAAAQAGRQRTGLAARG